MYINCKNYGDAFSVMLNNTLFLQLLVSDIQTIQPSLNSVNEGGQKIKSEAEQEFASRFETELRELNSQWDHMCRQVCTVSFTVAYFMSMNLAKFLFSLTSSLPTLKTFFLTMLTVETTFISKKLVVSLIYGYILVNSSNST